MNQWGSMQGLGLRLVGVEGFCSTMAAHLQPRGPEGDFSRLWYMEKIERVYKEKMRVIVEGFVFCTVGCLNDLRE